IQLQTRDQLVQAVAELENQTVRLQLIRNGERCEVSVTPRKMRVPEGSTAAAVSVAGMPSFPNGPIPGLDGEFGQVFPGVIIDEQFPADPEAIKRLLKRFGSEVRGEARRADEATSGNEELLKQLEQLRGELQSLREELRAAKKDSAE
ncbi:MAG: hypothetical protein RLZZ458_69, partial [Planctomycetota bacterium]